VIGDRLRHAEKGLLERMAAAADEWDTVKAALGPFPGRAVAVPVYERPRRPERKVGGVQ